MWRILGIVYLFSLANGLILLALKNIFPPAEESRRAPAEIPELDWARDDGIFAGLSVLLAGAVMTLAGILERLGGMR